MIDVAEHDDSFVCTIELGDPLVEIASIVQLRQRVLVGELAQHFSLVLDPALRGLPESIRQIASPAVARWIIDHRSTHRLELDISLTQQKIRLGLCPFLVT